QKIVEILRALHSDPKILILDEPTATLSAREKESLWTLIRKLPGDGVGVVLISHFMSEVLQLSDRITALQDGKIVASVEKKGLTGRDLVGFRFNRKGQSNSAYDFAKDSERKSPSPVDGNPVMSARQWTGHNFTVDDLEIHRGEIVGLIGLTGAGHADFAASIYQPAAAIAGALKIGGKDYSKA